MNRKLAKRIALFVVIAIILSLFVSVAMMLAMSLSGCSVAVGSSPPPTVSPTVNTAPSATTIPADVSTTKTTTMTGAKLNNVVGTEIILTRKTTTRTQTHTTTTTVKTVKTTAKPIKTTSNTTAKPIKLKTPGAVAITFDDGPSLRTAHLLDELNKYNIKVTFFVLGQSATSNPDLIRRMHAEGHQVGNHTWNHPDLNKVSDATLQSQLSRTNNAIEQITGVKPTVMRPPYGTRCERTYQEAKRQGLAVILWHDGPVDWKYPNDVDYVYNYLLRNVDKGEVIILHDTLRCAVEGFLKALPVLIERGYTFVTVDELVQLSPGAVYPASWR